MMIKDKGISSFMEQFVKKQASAGRLQEDEDMTDMTLWPMKKDTEYHSP